MKQWKMNNKNLLIRQIKSRLIVSCQAPVDSPLHDPGIVAAIARACVDRGAAGVRIDTPAHVKAVRQQLGDDIPHYWLMETAFFR